MKKKEIILLGIVVLGLLGIVLIANRPVQTEKTSQATEENSTGTANYLFDLKTPYLGNNSAVGRLLTVLDIEMYGQYTFELKTTEEPYALVIRYNLIEGWGNILDHPSIILEKSALLLALIDNVEEIDWILPDSEEVHKITVSDLVEQFGDIKEYGKSAKSLNQLLIQLDYFEETDPITMKAKNIKNTEITLTIENHTENQYTYGEAFSVETFIDGTWISVEDTPTHFTDIGYTLDPNQTSEKTYSWEIKLPSGTYRITKEFDQISFKSEEAIEFGKKYIVSFEFTI